MLKKLRLKFVLINMVIVAVMLTAIFATVYRLTEADLKTQSVSALRSLTQSAQLSGVIGRNEDVRLPYFVMQISLRGEIVAQGNTYLDLSDGELLKELSETVLSGAEIGRIPAYNLLYSRLQPDLRGWVVIFVDETGQKAALESLVKGCVFIGFAALIAFFGISILLARWAVKPVEKAWQQQKAFISDASHELKTPLTVIMSNAELLEAPDCPEENRQRFTGSILTMSQHMRKLIESMLELSRTDDGRVKMTFGHIDLSVLTEEVVLPFEPMFFEKGLMLESQIQPGICITGSEQYLRQVVEILLDNAAKYSAPGIVELALQRQGRGKCLLTVSNPGNPIPKAALKRIFDRFYRVDEARSRTGSFGLGLSIAQGIVREHNGKIWAQSNETGNCFSVLLPCDE